MSVSRNEEEGACGRGGGWATCCERCSPGISQSPWFKTFDCAALLFGLLGVGCVIVFGSLFGMSMNIHSQSAEAYDAMDPPADFTVVNSGCYVNGTRHEEVETKENRGSSGTVRQCWDKYLYTIINVTTVASTTAPAALAAGGPWTSAPEYHKREHPDGLASCSNVGAAFAVPPRRGYLVTPVLVKPCWYATNPPSLRRGSTDDPATEPELVGGYRCGPENGNPWCVKLYDPAEDKALLLSPTKSGRQVGLWGGLLGLSVALSLCLCPFVNFCCAFEKPGSRGGKDGATITP